MESYLPGARPYHRQNPLYEKLKLKEKEIMTFLHNLEMENMEARENKQELRGDNKGCFILIKGTIPFLLIYQLTLVANTHT